MASQDRINPLDLFLQGDDDPLGGITQLSFGLSTPRRLPPIAVGYNGSRSFNTIDETALSASDDAEYAVSPVAGGRRLSVYPSERSSGASTISLRTPNRAGMPLRSSGPSSRSGHTTPAGASRASSIYSSDASTPLSSVFTSATSQTSGSSSRSGHTTPAGASRASSIYSSEASTHASSVFTRATAQTSAGVTSNPPPRRHITNFVQTLAAAAAADYAPVNNIQVALPEVAPQSLWCEFCVIKNCPRTFRLDQTREWIEHHSYHLKDQYPTNLVCWLCHVPFVTEGGSNHDRRANFIDRMEHIREHISADGMTQTDMRPDFWMINHLGDNGLISDTMRRHALGYTELPSALRLPGSSASGSSQPYQQQRRPPGPSLAYDLDRERRYQRPRGGQRVPQTAIHEWQ